MPSRAFRTGAYSTRYTADQSYLVTPAVWSPSSASRAIVCCHGRGGTATQYMNAPAEAHVTALANAGFAVLSIDHARINSWGDPDGMRAIDDAYTYITTTLGITNTKIGLMGWSMGGLTALNWIKRNTSKVACSWLWNPVTDLRYFRDGSGAYTPPYSVGGAGASQGLYNSEINSTYAPTNTVSGSYTIPALGGAGITMNLTAFSANNVFADGHNNAAVGKPQATVNGTAFTYTSKTDTSLIGCVSTTASTIAVTNGMTITSSYATQSNGYRVRDEATQWNISGLPIKVCQATSDVTLPPAQNNDATLGFVALAGGSNVTLRSASGDHISSLTNVPTSEVVAFYAANL